jgi:3-oxoacyl-[acyl-carrier-protein] synthase-3
MPLVGISGIDYWLPETVVSVEDLEQEGLITSSADALRSMGFDRIHVARDDQERAGLALRAARSLLESGDVDPRSVDAMILFGALDSETAPGPAGGGPGMLIDQFRYPASRIQHELGLTRAVAFAIGQQGCASLTSALRLSRALLRSGDAERILCVGADAVPPGYQREVIYNVLSDGACALMVDAGHERLQPVAFRQITKGYYWDSPAKRTEIMAAYYPTARNVVNEALAIAGMTTADVALFIPDNISMQSWKILLELLEIPAERAYLENIAAHGHFVSADNIVNLKDALAAKPLPPGSPIVLFTFGFGANWSATVLLA